MVTSASAVDIIRFTPADISKLDPDNGVFVYFRGNTSIVLTKVKKEKYDLRDIRAF